jgi:AcrR family transcriptional regulator
VPSEGDPPARGLRERKKVRTRATIQRHAFRLFREQGYEATTVAQIAEAAEISQSTFFRYFPTKEDVVVWNDLGPRVMEAIRAQPATYGPIRALRSAMREVLGGLSAEETAVMRERGVLWLSTPMLQGVGADQIAAGAAEMAAARTGRSARDPAVRTLVGAVLGVMSAAMLEATDHPEADVVFLIDEALARLEAGLPV